MSRPSPDRLPTFARAAALLVLALLALGLPRLLQLCRPAEGPARVEFVGGHACCAHDHAVGDAGHDAAADHGSHGPCAGHSDCEHTALGVELQRLPTFALPTQLAAQPALGGIDVAKAPTPGSSVTTRQPPSTGPPRPERRSAQLVCTILRQ